MLPTLGLKLPTLAKPRWGVYPRRSKKCVVACLWVLFPLDIDFEFGPSGHWPLWALHLAPLGIGLGPLGIALGLAPLGVKFGPS